MYFFFLFFFQKKKNGSARRHRFFYTSETGEKRKVSLQVPPHIPHFRTHTLSILLVISILVYLRYTSTVFDTLTELFLFFFFFFQKKKIMDPPCVIDFSTLQRSVRKEKSLYKFHLTYLRYTSTVFDTLTEYGELFFFFFKKKKIYGRRRGFFYTSVTGEKIKVSLQVPPHIPQVFLNCIRYIN